MSRKLQTYITLLILSALSLVGCSEDDLNGKDVLRVGNTLVLRIQLAAPVGHTRATGNPTGGEQGDGWRVGRSNENNIYDVFLYKYSSPAGINASDDTPVTLMAFERDIDFNPSAPDANGIITHELTFNVGEYRYLSSNNDHFIAAINTEFLGYTTTLGQLRNELVTYTCRQMGTQMKDYDRFTMANAHDSEFGGGMGTKTDPYIVSIDVERTAARLDFAYAKDAKDAGKFRIEDGKYVYKVAGTDDELQLTHVRATNVMQSAPYLIKRLAATSTDSPAYLADETNQATKYVVEPTTWAKTIANRNALNYNYWFRDSWYLTAHENYMKNDETRWFRDQDKVHVGGNDTNEHNAFTDGTTLDEKENDWQYYVLGYANENTMLAAETHQNYTTGLILKGTYVPHEVYSSVDAGTGVLTADGTYAAGQTFWRCHEVDSNTDLFFSNAAAAAAYQALHPLSVVYPYQDAQCYYNVWLRHENVIDDPTTTMMEFGIVRNNIYRVCVEFTGIGMPDIPEEMVTPETVRMFIFVRKWNLIEHPTIEI